MVVRKDSKPLKREAKKVRQKRKMDEEIAWAEREKVH